MVRIRLAEGSDALTIAAIYRPSVELTAVSFETVPPAAEEVARRITDTLKAHPWIVCELDGAVVGYAYASRHAVRAAYRWSVDVSIYIDAGSHRLGIGRGLYASLPAILRAQGYVNAYAGIALPNDASVALHEAMGFRPVGVYRRVGYKFGKWHDVGWWSLALGSHDTDPVEPRTLNEIQRDAGWASLLEEGTAHIRRR